MRRIIWSSDDLLNNAARADYQSELRKILDDDAYEVGDEEWAEEVYSWLNDQRYNLNRQVNGVIVAFYDFGLWYGRKRGAQILGNNVADILHTSWEYAEWYGDDYNIRSRMICHDGTNYALYRFAKSHKEAEHIVEKIFNHEIDEQSFRKRTCSLYPYVADVYGWPWPTCAFGGIKHKTQNNYGQI